MRVTGEMKERYGRDENDLSHAETPFYKGDSEDNGRDERIFEFRDKEEIELKAKDIPWGLCSSSHCRFNTSHCF